MCICIFIFCLPCFLKIQFFFLFLSQTSNTSIFLKLNNNNFLSDSNKIMKGLQLIKFLDSHNIPQRFSTPENILSNIINFDFLFYKQVDQLLVTWLLISMCMFILTKMVGLSFSSHICKKTLHLLCLPIKSYKIKKLTKMQLHHQHLYSWYKEDCGYISCYKNFYFNRWTHWGSFRWVIRRVWCLHHCCLSSCRSIHSGGNRSFAIVSKRASQNVQD